jgi:S-DNA-T family DNA segregation ATPase FtsK/SpoIIIE
MDFTVSVHLPRRRPTVLDVVVEDGDDVPAQAHPHTVADLRTGLAALLGEPVPGLLLGGMPLADGTVLGRPPLLHGCSLVVAAPAPAATRSTAAPGPGSPPGAHPTRPWREAATTPLALAVTGGPDCGHLRPVPSGGLTVGRSGGCDLVLDDPDLSRRHARLSLSAGGLDVADLGSTNGVGRQASPAVRLGASTLRLRPADQARVPTSPTGSGRLLVHRSPRVMPPLPEIVLEEPAPPAAPARGRVPWVAAVAPLPVAAVLAVVFGPQYLLFAATGPLMMLGNVVAERISARRTHTGDHAAYAARLADRSQAREAALAAEQRQRDRAHPDPAAVLAVAVGPGRRLWERSRDSPDALVIRVGSGPVPARLRWVSAAPGEAPTATHPCLEGAPVTVGLVETPVLGVAGPPEAVLGVARSVVGQLAVLHSPLDLRLWLASEPEPAPGAAGWGWWPWLPHAERPGALPTSESGGARHVVVVDLRHGRPAPPGLLALLETAAGGRMSFVVLAPDLAHLPSRCAAVLKLADGTGTVLHRHGFDPQLDVIADRVGWWWAERLSRALAPLVDGRPGPAGAAEPPDAVRLDELVGFDPADPDAVSGRWALAPSRQYAPIATLGATGSGPWRVDLRTDGPHVLVGGTTGSGKSELLQALVASLAVELPPEAVSFVLIDYKGGSAFAACAGLPHTVGVVTDLDEHLTARALTSLRAELARRERVLARVAARDIEDYWRRRRPGDPDLGRLVLVVDEFRLLAEDQPEFLGGILHLATVGRSLGVHLVLATQRPAGVVSADIAANVNLRIALRVRDRADSLDVIETPDAAAVPADRPGRGLARAGGGPLVAFQAARVSAPPRGRGSPGLVLRRAVTPDSHDAGPGAMHPVAGDDTDLARIVSAASTAAARRGHPSPHRPWQPPLPGTVPLDTLQDDGEAPAVGLADLPREQRREPLRWDPLGGHWLVSGGARSGRTTVALTVTLAAARRWGPADLQLYAVDGSGALGPLARLPHTGTLVGLDEPARASRLLGALAAEVRTRSTGLAAAGAADLTEWRALAATGAAAPTPPPILLVVDGWERVVAASDVVGGGPADQLVGLLRDGAACGLGAVVTGDRSVLVGRLPALATDMFLLGLADPVDAALVGLVRADLPHHPPPGRAVRARDGVEVQLAHPGPSPDGTGLRMAADAVAARWTGQPSGRHPPIRVRGLPATVAWTQIPEPPPWCVGLGGDDAGPVTLDPGLAGRRLLVAGPPGSGRTTALATFGSAALAAGRALAVVAEPDALLADYLLARGAVAAATAYDLESLVDARRTHPDLVVLVDDADAVADTPAEPVLQEIGRLVDRDNGVLVVAASPAAVLTRLRGVTVDVARRQRGLLLHPQGPADAAVFGVAAPRGLPGHCGRGLLVAGRSGVEVQVALPPEWPAATTC